MFTKQKKNGFFSVHPLCSMLAGALVAVGALSLILAKRHTISAGARKMADVMDAE